MLLSKKLQRRGRESFRKEVNLALKTEATKIVRKGLEDLKDKVDLYGSTEVIVRVPIEGEICGHYTSSVYRKVVKRTPVDIKLSLNGRDISFSTSELYDVGCGKKEYNQPTWRLWENSFGHVNTIQHNLQHLKAKGKQGVKIQAFTQILEFMRCDVCGEGKNLNDWDRLEECSLGEACLNCWSCTGCTKHPLKTPEIKGGIGLILSVLIPWSQKNPEAIVQLHTKGDPYEFYRSIYIPDFRREGKSHIAEIKDRIVEHLQKLRP